MGAVVHTGTSATGSRVQQRSGAQKPGCCPACLLYTLFGDNARMLTRIRRPALGLALFSLFLFPGHAQSQTLAEAVEIDANAASHPVPHFWEKMFGSGRAILSLRDDY